MSDRSKDKPPLSSTLLEAVTEEVRTERQESLTGPDTPEGRELGRTVGKNLVAHRTEHDLDLDRLAERSGIHRDLLIALEEGRAIPSLRAVWHLATTLGLSFGELLAAEESDIDRSDFRVQRSGEGRLIASADDSFHSRVLFEEGDPRTPEVYELTLAPGCVEAASPHASGTYEHIAVVSGRLVIRAGDDEAELGPGDAVFFRADQPHGYHNRGDDTVRAHLVMHMTRR